LSCSVCRVLRRGLRLQVTSGPLLRCAIRRMVKYLRFLSERLCNHSSRPLCHSCSTSRNTSIIDSNSSSYLRSCLLRLLGNITTLNIVPDLMRLAEGVRITELKSVDVLRGWREHCASIVEANWRFALGHDGRAGINQ